jgi:hypothetical protein
MIMAEITKEVQKVEVTGSSKMLVSICKTTQRHVPEDSYLDTAMGNSYLRSKDLKDG